MQSERMFIFVSDSVAITYTQYVYACYGETT